MKPILDRVVAERRGDFSPSNPTEFFALRLAIRLGTPPTARHLALLAAEHGIDRLLAIFHRTMAVASAGEDLARRFHHELTTHSTNGARTPCIKLVGIRVERRCVGAAIFRETRLESVRVRQLPANPMKTEATLIAFISQLIREHGFESAALEVVSEQAVQRATLTRVVLNHLRENSVSIWELNKSIVAAAFGHPPLKTRTELRKVIQAIWPQLNPKRGQICVLDAAAMGLLIQTERLFNNF